MAKEREEAFQFCLVGLGAVFAEFVSFGVFDFGGGVFAVPVFEVGAETRGLVFVAFGEGAADFGMALGFVAFGREEMLAAISTAFVELGNEDTEGIEFLVDDAIDGEGDVGLERVGFLKAVRIIHEDGVFGEVGDIGTEEGNCDHVSGILHENAGVAVVGVVIVWTRAEHEVGVPLANGFGDELAVFEGGEEFAIVNVEDFGFDAEDFSGLFDFSQAAFGEGSAGFAPVADVAVGDGNEFYFMAFGSPHGGGTADLDFAVVRVSAEGDDAERFGGFGGVRQMKGEQEETGKSQQGFHGIV